MKDCSEIECLYLMVIEELSQSSSTDVFARTARSFISCLLAEDRYRKTAAHSQGEDPTESNWKQELHQQFAFRLYDREQHSLISTPHMLRLLLMRSGAGQYKDPLLQHLALAAGSAPQMVVPNTESLPLCLIDAFCPAECASAHTVAGSSPASP